MIVDKEIRKVAQGLYVKVALIIALIVGIGTQTLDAASLTDERWVMFLGRLHVVVLHLPIGFLLLAAIFESLTMVRLRLIDARAQMLMWLFGSAAAMVTVLFGLILSQEESELSDTAFWHMWLGISSFATSLLVIYLFRKMACTCAPSIKLTAGYRLSALLCVVCVALSGHKGGEISHGANYVDKYAPWNPVKEKTVSEFAETTIETDGNVDVDVADSSGVGDRKMPGTDADTDMGDMQTVAAVKKTPEILANIALYENHIVVILKDRCYECHGAKKHKSDLRLDTPAFIVQGGEEGEVIVPGQPELSSLYTLTVLDKDDPDIMPSKGKVLNKMQTTFIYRWIKGGAHFKNKVIRAQEKKDIDTRESRIERDSKEIALPDQKSLDILIAKGVGIEKLSSNGAFLDLDMRYLKGALVGEDHAALQRIAGNIRWLDCGRTGANDDNMKIIARCLNLQRLMLHQTKVTDAGLALIKELNNIEVLNLYKTAITDKGLRHLHGMKKLKKIYLWQTKVSQAGISALKKSIPDIEIIMGE